MDAFSLGGEFLVDTGRFDLLLARCRDGDLSRGGATIFGWISRNASSSFGGCEEGGGGLKIITSYF